MSCTVLIPMAGEGSRFKKAGFAKPKPFIDVMGIPMIEHVIQNMSTIRDAKFVLVARQEHIDAEKEIVAQLSKKYNATIVTLDKLTEGTACTVLHAREYIQNDIPLLIVNSDQYIDHDISVMIDECKSRKLDGSILTFTDHEKNPKWSFARIDENDLVTEVKEKQPISDKATVGIYYFTRGNDFVNYAVDMIVHNERVNNEFYTAPVYNWAIRDGRKIGYYNIPVDAMNGLGTPEDLELFLKKNSVK